MVEICGSDRIGLGEAARILGVHPATVFRWIRGGCRGVKLDYARAGRKIIVSRDALEDFARRLREADDIRFATPTVPVEDDIRPTTPRVREREVAAAKDRLRARGMTV